MLLVERGRFDDRFLADGDLLLQPRAALGEKVYRQR
jgi:hypothetical protein